MPELLRWINFQMETVSENSFGRFLTTDEHLPPVVFLASPGWLILSVTWGGMPELLALYWEESTYRWRLYHRTPLYGFCHYSFILVFHYCSTRTGNSLTTCRAPYRCGRHWYDGVLSSAPKGFFMTLLSPTKCHAALSTILHTLASVDQSPICRPKMLPPSTMRMPRVWILEELLRTSCVQ
jgi:hypothetical protein